MKLRMLCVSLFAVIMFAANMAATSEAKKVVINCVVPANSLSDTAAMTFLKLATNAGLSEIALGKMAQQKASHISTRAFAAMIVEDHTQANKKLKTLAVENKVSLPIQTSADKLKKAKELKIKSGRDFDQSFIDLMIDDHKAAIALFERYQKIISESEVKAFIASTLPHLKMHLDSAQAVSQTLMR